MTFFIASLLFASPCPFRDIYPPGRSSATHGAADGSPLSQQSLERLQTKWLPNQSGVASSNSKLMRSISRHTHPSFPQSGGSTRARPTEQQQNVPPLSLPSSTRSCRLPSLTKRLCRESALARRAVPQLDRGQLAQPLYAVEPCPFVFAHLSRRHQSTPLIHRSTARRCRNATTARGVRAHALHTGSTGTTHARTGGHALCRHPAHRNRHTDAPSTT